MKKGYKRLLIFILFIFIILLINSFSFNFLLSYKMIIFMIFLLLFFGNYFIFEKCKKRYIYDILFEVMICIVTFFILYYLLGLIIGLAKNKTYFSINGIKDFIIPISIFCILREFFRYNMLCKAEDNKMCTISVVLLFIMFDISNDIFYSNFDSSYDLFRFIALVLLPTISKNISYSYLSKKIGYIPIIIFDLVLSLFPYIIPIIPNPNEYIYSIIQLITPALFACRILKFFELKKDDKIPRDYRKKRAQNIVIPIIVILPIIYFYSGYFKYYVIAVASGSMNPNIKVGDIVVVDQRFDEININDVIAYKKDQVIIVHRVVKKINYKDEYLYYTKGDANNNIDDFVIEKDMIVGKVTTKIPYIGYPTVWLNK